MDPDELQPGGWLRRLSQDSDSMLARLNDLDASPHTKRLIAEACSKIKEAEVNYDIER